MSVRLFKNSFTAVACCTRSRARINRHFCTRALSSSISDETIARLSAMELTNLSIQDLLQSGLGTRSSVHANANAFAGKARIAESRRSPSEVRLQFAAYLHAELPKRYAHRIKELDALPRLLRMQPPIQRVRQDFVADIAAITGISQPPTTAKEDLIFAHCVQTNMQRHSSTLILTAHGLFRFQQQQQQQQLPQGQVKIPIQ